MPKQRTIEELQASNRELVALLKAATAQRDAYAKDRAAYRARFEAQKSAIARGVRNDALNDIANFAAETLDVDENGDLRTIDAAGATPGLRLEQWLDDHLADRKYLLDPSKPDGDRRRNAKNPFSAEHWNLTEQGRLVRSDRAQAERLASEAGTKLGGSKPEA